jgi:hypothetical protein
MRSFAIAERSHAQRTVLLVADLRRHLNHEPVEAGPPSASYRLRKFARRNRELATPAVAAALLPVSEPDIRLTFRRGIQGE